MCNRKEVYRGRTILDAWVAGKIEVAKDRIEPWPRQQLSIANFGISIRKGQETETQTGAVSARNQNRRVVSVS